MDCYTILEALRKKTFFKIFAKKKIAQSQSGQIHKEWNNGTILIFKKEKFPAIEHDIERVSKGKAYEAQVINMISNGINSCGSQGQEIKRGDKE